MYITREILNPNPIKNAKNFHCKLFMLFSRNLFVPQNAFICKGGIRHGFTQSTLRPRRWLRLSKPPLPSHFTTFSCKICLLVCV